MTQRSILASHTQSLGLGSLSFTLVTIGSESCRINCSGLFKNSLIYLCQEEVYFASVGNAPWKSCIHKHPTISVHTVTHCAF